MASGQRLSPRAGGGKLTIESYGNYYFSGNQCRLYFDGVYMAEIPYLELSLSNNKTPIYSYNDPYYKVVARGNVLVQGSFYVNLTDRDYLLKAKTEIRSKRVQARKKEQENLLKPMRGMSDNSIVDVLDNTTSRQREGVIQALIDTFWGTFKTNNQPSPWLRPDEWDLYSDGDIDPDGFDIVMVYGIPMGPENQFTIKQINDVHITGESMVTDTSGQGIIQQFTYFARKIDGKVTSFYDRESILRTPLPEEEVPAGQPPMQGSRPDVSKTPELTKEQLKAMDDISRAVPNLKAPEQYDVISKKSLFAPLGTDQDSTTTGDSNRVRPKEQPKKKPIPTSQVQKTTAGTASGKGAPLIEASASAYSHSGPAGNWVGYFFIYPPDGWKIGHVVFDGWDISNAGINHDAISTGYHVKEEGYAELTITVPNSVEKMTLVECRVQFVSSKDSSIWVWSRAFSTSAEDRTMYRPGDIKDYR